MKTRKGLAWGRRVVFNGGLATTLDRKGLAKGLSQGLSVHRIVQEYGTPGELRRYNNLRGDRYDSMIDQFMAALRVVIGPEPGYRIRAKLKRVRVVRVQRVRVNR